MSHYRKIDVHIWNDARFMSLSLHGRLGWLMLLTHPMMTSLGAIRATPDGLAAELAAGDEGLREAFREAFQDIIDKGMADYDPKANLIALPNFVKYNKPENPNVVKAWVGAAGMLPECELKDVTIQRAVAVTDGMGKGFGETARKAFPKGYRKGYPKGYGTQRAEKQRAESSDSDSALDEEDSSEGTSTRTHTHARETMFTPFPIPSSSAEGKAFLINKGVHAEKLDECLRLLLGGGFSPYELEGVLSESRDAA